MGKRRYQITLPAEFNDGRLIADDVDDTAEHRAWISHLKSHLLRRFQQLEIYVTSYPVEVY
jgi:hypothetical protein